MNVKEKLSLKDLPGEVWKLIPGYEDRYMVSNMGRVKSLKRRSEQHMYLKERIMKQSFVSGGHLAVKLTKNGSKMMGTHQLVAMAFLNHTPCGYKAIVDHKNRVADDNRLVNLQILTQRENIVKDKDRGVSRYVGVVRCKRSNKWISTIEISGKRKYLGLYKSERNAHLAYQKELRKYKEKPMLIKKEIKKMAEKYIKENKDGFKGDEKTINYLTNFATKVAEDLKI